MTRTDLAEAVADGTLVASSTPPRRSERIVLTEADRLDERVEPDELAALDRESERLLAEFEEGRGPGSEPRRRYPASAADLREAIPGFDGVVDELREGRR